MPLYDFQCTNPKCDGEFEVFYKEGTDMTKTEELRCPKCGKPAKKIPSLTARMKWDWSKWNIQGS